MIGCEYIIASILFFLLKQDSGISKIPLGAMLCCAELVRLGQQIPVPSGCSEELE